MNNQQSLAFQAASGITPETMLLAIASAVILIALVWVIWMAFGNFQAWFEGGITLFDVLWLTIRASIVLLVLGFYLR